MADGKVTLLEALMNYYSRQDVPLHPAAASIAPSLDWRDRTERFSPDGVGLAPFLASRLKGRFSSDGFLSGALTKETDTDAFGTIGRMTETSRLPVGDEVSRNVIDARMRQPRPLPLGRWK